MSKKKTEKKPFFARFLESQELEQVSGGKHKRRNVTKKYPSDDDEYQTLKYPSDSDESTSTI